MTRKRMKNIYLFAVFAWTMIYILILFFLDPFTKTEAWGIDDNSYYLWTLWILTATLPAYIHFFITNQIFVNFLLSATLVLLIYPLSIFAVDKFIIAINSILQLNEIVKWTSIFKFLDIIIAHYLILTLLGLIKKILPKKIRISNAEPILKFYMLN
ncbi:hypothetical protein BH11BAC7_BH11BAC7_36090 [soil metagenome]